MIGAHTIYCAVTIISLAGKMGCSLRYVGDLQFLCDVMFYDCGYRYNKLDSILVLYLKLIPLPGLEHSEFVSPVFRSPVVDQSR